MPFLKSHNVALPGGAKLEEKFRRKAAVITYFMVIRQFITGVSNLLVD